MFHLDFMEAGRTVGPVVFYKRATKELRKMSELNCLTWQSFLELSLAGFTWTGVKFGVVTSLPRYSHPSTCAHVGARTDRIAHT